MIPNKFNELQILVDEMDEKLKSMLRVEDGSLNEQVFDYTYGAMESVLPYIGPAIQGIRIRNLKKGIKEINRVLSEMNVSLDGFQEKFVKEEAIPLILRKIEQEEQEEKISIFVNGFDSIIHEDMYNSDSLYEYYDVLQSLRLKEIGRLLELYNQEYSNQASYNVTQINFDGTSIEYIDNKLVQLGLRRVITVDAGTWGSVENPQQDTEFTSFGIEFVKFFKSRKINK